MIPGRSAKGPCTREARPPRSPQRVASVQQRSYTRLAAAGLLAAAQAAEPGAIIDGTDRKLRKAVVPNAIGRFVWAEEITTGKRRNLSYDEEEAFSGQDYFPETLGRQTFYDPPERGFEREIRKRLDYWAKLRADRNKEQE